MVYSIGCCWHSSLHTPNTVAGLGIGGGGGGKPPTTGIPVVYRGRGHSYIYSDLLEIEGRLYLRAVTKENLALLLSTVTKTTGH